MYKHRFKDQKKLQFRKCMDMLKSVSTQKILIISRRNQMSLIAMICVMKLYLRLFLGINVFSN